MTSQFYQQNLKPRSLSVLIRTFKAATNLGWQIETNWATPFVFAIYSVIKPIASAAILVVMYSVITLGDFESAIFSYIYIGNAFYIYVGAVMSGISWSVIDDREHYKMLKYMYIAPLHYPTYLVGRGVAKFVFGSLSVFITLMFGVIFLKVPLVFGQINWGLLIISLILGVLMLIFMGLMLGSITLIIANHVWFLGDSVAGALYLFSGAIFPLDVLPSWLQPIGYAMPITYWLELIRRSLVGQIANQFPTLERFSNLELVGILLILTSIFGIISYFIYRKCDAIAREKGMIDMVTNY